METPLQYLTNEHGERTAVVLSLKDYETLLEDLSDLAAIVNSRHEIPIPHDEFIAELKRDGIL